MMSQDQTLKSLFQTAERKRKELENAINTNTPEYRNKLSDTLSTYESCRDLADRISLFSPNESSEDIASGDLEYLLIDYYLGELFSRLSDGKRKSALETSRHAYERYLARLDQYELLSTPEKKLFETYNNDPASFSTLSSKDPSVRRATKIANFKQETELKRKLEYLAQNPAYLAKDEDAVRELHLANLSLSTHHTFQALESINLEMEILAMAPPNPPVDPKALEQDYRERNGIPDSDGYSDKLDRPIHEILGNKTGPILSKDGKPLRPFTILDQRQQLQKGVFRPGHNLPTMTIDEYLEEERARGGIIEGGGEASGILPEPDEDNYEKADQETMKARAWDEFTEANPKGAGNTLNRG